MKKVILLLLTVFAFLPEGEAQNSLTGSALFGDLRARQIGPASMSGRITSIAAVPGESEVIYVGTASGGIWKTVSGGAVVRPVFDDHTMSIGKITIDPNDKETIWVGTGETWTRNSVSVGNGLYKSTNGGGTWDFMGFENSERIADIIVHPENSDVVYVAVLGHLWDANEERGVYKTTDGGTTWTKILYIDADTGASDLDIDPENPDILYAAMWSFRRQPWTFDSGFTGGSGLFKTTDGGGNWNKIHNGLPDEKLGRMAIAVAPSNGDLIYLSVECKSADKKGLYLSTDSGDSWKKVSNDNNTTIRPFYFSNMIVDPHNDSIVMKCGLQAIISEDRGSRFRAVDQSVHSDIHDIWIDPANTKHLLLATDGGVYESLDRGRTFKMWMNLPVSQFYHVSVDDEIPYNVYGGLQDNGSWFGPSQKSGGITNADWESTYGGDGFYSFRHPKNKNIIFSESQGGGLVRYNNKSGRAKNIQPFKQGDEKKYRFNWNAPIHISSKNPDRMYFGSQYLFVTQDMGDSWKRISPDLTTNDPEKQKQHLSGGLSLDNSTAENHCTIYSIAESNVDENIIWVGTDDGNLQVTDDGGNRWVNVSMKVPGLPKNTWVTFIETSHFDAKTAYVTFDDHRRGNMETYVYKTTDLGQTWTPLATEDVEGYALSVREDLVKPNLLFLGTEFGLYISIDSGENWARFKNNMPKVGVRDMVIHPRDHDLVMGTHGRGVIILDDITSLRQLDGEMAASSFKFLDKAPTVLRDPGAGGAWFGGSGNFVGQNPSTAAQIVYFMNRRHLFGKMYIEIWKDGELLRTLPAGKSAGINIVDLPTALKKPKAAPTKNRMALFGSLFGPNLPAGEYEARVVKGKNEYKTTFSLVYDPLSEYSVEDRELQREYAMKLYNMTEDMAYIYDALSSIEKQAGDLAESHPEKAKKINPLKEKAATEKNKLVSLEGDFYVAEGEPQLREKISDMYRMVSSYPGRPSQSQMDATDQLQEEMKAVNKIFQSVLELMGETNVYLEKKEITPVSIQSREEFLAGEDEKSDSDGQFFQKSNGMYKELKKLGFDFNIF